MKILRDLKFRIHFFIFSKLKNGVIELKGEESLKDAHKKIKKGGYIILSTSQKK